MSGAILIKGDGSQEGSVGKADDNEFGPDYVGFSVTGQSGSPRRP